jgi:hypothetical protein
VEAYSGTGSLYEALPGPSPLFCILVCDLARIHRGIGGSFECYPSRVCGFELGKGLIYRIRNLDTVFYVITLLQWTLNARVIRALATNKSVAAVIIPVLSH